MSEILVSPPSVLGRRLLLGQNAFHADSVMTAEIDLAGLAELHSNDVPEFASNFTAAFGLRGNPLSGWSGLGDFARRLSSPGSIPLSDCLLAATLALDGRAVAEMGFADRISFASVGRRTDTTIGLIWETFDPAISRDAVEVALTGIAMLSGVKVPGATVFERGVKRLLEQAAARRLDPLAAVLKTAAAQTSLPVHIVDKDIVLGEGACQKRPFAKPGSMTARRAKPAGNAGPDSENETFYRLFMIDSACIAAVRCHPAAVTGDGRMTIGGLVAALNEAPDRDGIRLCQVAVDDRFNRHLAAQGMTVDTVPALGRVVRLSPDGALASGATTEDVTGDVHPDYCVLAARAASRLGLDVAGIDLVSPDITRPPPDPDRVIRGVDARPNPAVHLWPRDGQPRDVARAVLDHLFPDRRKACIPSLVFAGDRATSSAALQAGKLLADAGLDVGMALKSGVVIGGVRHELPEGRITRAPAMILRNVAVEAIVTALSLRRINDYGLGLSRCDGVALQLDRGQDSGTTKRGIEVLARACEGPFTIDADHPAAAAVVERLGAERVVFVSPSRDLPALSSHLAAGGLVAIREWSAEGPRVRLIRQDEVLASAPLESRTHTRERLIYAGIHAFALVQASGLAAGR